MIRPIAYVIRLDDARSDVSQNMDADDELKLGLSAVVIATIAKKRKKRRQTGAIVLGAAVDLQSPSFWWI